MSRRRYRGPELPLFDALSVAVVPEPLASQCTATHAGERAATHAGWLRSRRGPWVEIVWGTEAECRSRCEAVALRGPERDKGHWVKAAVVPRAIQKE